MSIVKFNTMGPTTRLESDINRLLQDVFSAPGQIAAATGSWRPRVDVQEDENGYRVDMEIPGIPKEKIAVEFEDGTLKISGERSVENETNDRNIHRMERRYGSFSRSFSFDTAVSAEEITASQADGVLTINLPKAEEVKPKKISIS